jgi:tRNA dimethylallyltransferase
MSEVAAPPGVLPPAILLMGPTASGKTAVALELSRRFPVELISVDSAQVFRDMDIGTAKPDAATLAEFPHQLIDLISPQEAYSAARFRADALRAMAAITARGRVPLLVGGTMLYFKALRRRPGRLAGSRPGNTCGDRPGCRCPGVAGAARRTRRGRSGNGGAPAAQRCTTHPARARSLSPFRPPAVGADHEREKAAPPYRFVSVGLLPSDRSVLHQRIADRFRSDACRRAGSRSRVLARTYPYILHLPSMRCVGYRQVWEVQDGLAPRRELRERGIYATRQLAKRQITWIGNTLRPQTVDCLSPDLAGQVSRIIGSIFA